MTATKNFAKKLKLLREGNGLSLKKTAEHLGVTAQSLSLYENGMRTINIDLLKKVAQYFKVSSDYLIGLSDTATIDTEIKAVCDYTGLDDDAVETLSLINGEGKKGNAEETLILNCLSYFIIWGMKDFISDIINNYKELQKKEKEKKQLKSDAEDLQSAGCEKNFESTQKYLQILDKLNDIDEEIAFIEYKNLRCFRNNVLIYLYDLLAMEEDTDNGEHQTPKE